MSAQLLTIPSSGGFKVYVGKTPTPGVIGFLEDVFEVKELFMQPPPGSRQGPQFAYLCIQMGLMKSPPEAPFYQITLDEGSPIYKEYIRASSGIDLTSKIIGGTRGN